jgi:hypothetical protein
VQESVPVLVRVPHCPQHDNWLEHETNNKGKKGAFYLWESSIQHCNHACMLHFLSSSQENKIHCRIGVGNMRGGSVSGGGMGAVSALAGPFHICLISSESLSVDSRQFSVGSQICFRIHRRVLMPWSTAHAHKASMNWTEQLHMSSLCWSRETSGFHPLSAASSRRGSPHSMASHHHWGVDHTQPHQEQPK